MKFAITTKDYLIEEFSLNEQNWTTLEVKLVDDARPLIIHITMLHEDDYNSAGLIINSNFKPDAAQASLPMSFNVLIAKLLEGIDYAFQMNGDGFYHEFFENTKFIYVEE